MTPRLLVAALAGLAVCAAAGCEKKLPAVVPCEGVVTLDGKPLPLASVTFMPMLDNFGAESNSTAVTDAEGRFALTCLFNQRPGAVVALHTVMVAESELTDEMRNTQDSRAFDALVAKRGNRPIPPEYGAFGRTPLKVEVKQGVGPIKLELTRGPVAKPG